MKKNILFILAAIGFCLGLAAGLLADKGLEGEPDSWQLKHFEDVFIQEYPTATEEYTLLSGTEEENTVTVLRGEADGPTIYVVAGVHGDEQAGWRAGNLLKTASIQAGTLYILSPANLYGAEQDQRRTKSERDLNRSFPGTPDGWDAERIAWSVFSDIQAKQPDLVLDLHEAYPKEDDYEKLGANYDALGNSLICQSLDGIGDLILEALMVSEAGELCSSPLVHYGSPPSGSVNQTVTDQLGIPTITVETLRSEPLAQRVGNHLDLVEFVLKFYEMR